MGTKVSVRVELDHEGFRQLLTGPEITTFIDQQADRMADRAGDGFVTRKITGGYGGGRHVAFVGTGTGKAMRAQAKDKALSRALHTMAG